MTSIKDGFKGSEGPQPEDVHFRGERERTTTLSKGDDVCHESVCRTTEHCVNVRTLCTDYFCLSERHTQTPVPLTSK